MPASFSRAKISEGESTSSLATLLAMAGESACFAEGPLQAPASLGATPVALLEKREVRPSLLPMRLPGRGEVSCSTSPLTNDGSASAGSGGNSPDDEPCDGRVRVPGMEASVADIHVLISSPNSPPSPPSCNASLDSAATGLAAANLREGEMSSQCVDCWRPTPSVNIRLELRLNSIPRMLDPLPFVSMTGTEGNVFLMNDLYVLSRSFSSRLRCEQTVSWPFVVCVHCMPNALLESEFWPLKDIVLLVRRTIGSPAGPCGEMQTPAAVERAGLKAAGGGN
mmetsp:Transcript_41655/g.114941  ORF Transcript_41655/g.114941 Transcript_41655/m.114941 type:complete len:281 (+) Transcript_41655:2335-3177(+)